MSIKTIAEMTGLSITTVSHALNGTRPVSQRSMELINEAAAQINYRPNLAAQMMKTHRSRTVAIIIPATEQNNSTNCFFFDVLNGAKSRLQESGYELIVSTYPESRPQDFFSGMSILHRRWIDGILLVPPTLRYEDIARIEDCGVPVVLVDRWGKGGKLPLVCSNNREVTVEAMKVLYQAGRRRIAFIGADFPNSTAVERYQGYLDVLEELGLPRDELLICRMDAYSMSCGMEAARRVLGAGADAIFAANSMLCLGTVKELQEQGIHVPEQVAVIGFDNYEWTEITNPPLTAVTQNASLMGRTASELLLQLLDGKQPEQRVVRIPAALTIRQSHGL
mgnify:FL=1